MAIRRGSCRGPAMCSFMLILLSALVTNAFTTTVHLTPGTGQMFLQAVADFGSSGVDTIIYLPRGQVLSLANTSVVNAVQAKDAAPPFSSGVLTIAPSPAVTGGDDSSPTVLDAAMLSGLASVNGEPAIFTGTAELRLINITVVNQCDIFMPFTPTWAMSSSLGMPLFFRNCARRTQTYSDVTLYVRQADLAAYLYVQWVYLSPFRALWSGLTKAIEQYVTPPPENMFQLISAYSVVLSPLEMPAYEQVNTTLKSTGDPNDPLLSSLQAQGLLLPPRYCFGPPVTPPTGSVDPAQPLWITTDTQSWLTALKQAISLSHRPPVDPVRGRRLHATTGNPQSVSAILVITGAVLPAALRPMPTLPPLLNNLLMTGYDTDPSSTFSAQGVLDFGNSLSFRLPVAPTGGLFMQQLTLKGLAAYPQPRSPTPSALPLAVFPTSEGSGPVSMHTVTLELPDLDYMALVALADPALSTTLNMTVLQHADALKQGMSALSSAQLSQGYSSLTLSVFAGWGINATNLRIVPVNPDVATSMALAYQQSRLSSQASPAARSQHIRTVVGCSVATAVAVCALVLGGALLVRWREWKAKEQRHRDEPVEVSSPGHPTLDTTSSPLDTSVSGRQSSSSTATPPAPAAAPPHSPATPPAPAAAPPHSTAALPARAAAPPHSTAATASAPGLPPAAGVGSAELQVVAQQARALERKDVKELKDFCGEQSVLNLQAGDGALGVAGCDPDQVLVVLPGSTTPGSSTTALHSHADQAGTPAGSDADSSEVSDGVASKQQAQASGPSGACVPGACEDPLLAVDQIARCLANDNLNMVCIQGVLGQGSWGTVYSGVWRGLPVAVKTLVFESAEEGEAVAQCAEGGLKVQRQAQAVLEAAVAISVDHSNVVHTYYYDIQRIDTPKYDTSIVPQLQVENSHLRATKTYKMFLVQELCSANLLMALHSRVFHDRATRRPLDVATSLAVLLDIAQGLEYLHSRNIIHGDLKPANVLLQTHSTRAVAKLADFGLSACLTGGQTHISNYSKGSPFYVAPEVVTSHKTSPASDIFSFGVIMWEVHTGETPYLDNANGGSYLVWNPLFPKFTAASQPSGLYIALMQRCLSATPPVDLQPLRWCSC